MHIRWLLRRCWRGVVSQTCHAFAESGGHERTRQRAKLGTRGHCRNRRDTGGHDVRRVRDREAPGSNPGPPTTFVFRTGDSARRQEPDGAQPGHRFAEMPLTPRKLKAGRATTSHAARRAASLSRLPDGMAYARGRGQRLPGMPPVQEKNSSNTGARTLGLTPCVWRARVRSCALGMASLMARAASRMDGAPAPPCMTSVGVVMRDRRSAGRECPSPRTSLSYASVGASFSSPRHIGRRLIASTCLSDTPTDLTNRATASPLRPDLSNFLSIL